jgi:bifunctional pyridoxal-dependent enzyme with beta-cystathionase and maltose regulon repressor activities
LAATLAAELPAVTMRVPEATYLAWLDCRALELVVIGDEGEEVDVTPSSRREMRRDSASTQVGV